ncbi:MAG: lipocalin family protein [Spirochaetota bacterium]
MRYIAAGFLVLSIFTGCTTALPEETASLLVPTVDLQKYAGLWYQVARYPHSFQSKPCGDSTAEYTLRENGKISVLNVCWKGEYGGEINQRVRAVAKPVSEAGNRLRVTFFGIFPASYLIIELDDEDYQWAAVTTPKKDLLWILSRTPSLDKSMYQNIVDSLVEKGFDESKIVKTSRQE